MNKKLNLPKFGIIEHCAYEFACVWYEAARSAGMTSKHKTARLWALHNFQKFLPQSIEHLTSMLSCNDIHENLKERIYEALMERVNDPDVKAVFPNDNLLPEINLKQLLDKTSEKPVTIVTDYFKDKRLTKQKLLTGVAHGGCL